MSTGEISTQENAITDSFQEPLGAEKLAKTLSRSRQGIEEKFEDIMHEELKLGSFVSYVGNKKIPFLRIYKYKEAFSFKLVNEFLKRFEADSNDYVFDPFSGLGTTMFTSMLNSVPSVGVDKLPLAHFISKTMPLLLQLKENELKKLWKSLTPKIQGNEPADVALDVSIMKKSFDEETLSILRKLKSTIDGLSFPYHDILLLLFFSILEECSFTSKDGQFLRLQKNKRVSNPIEAMKRKIMEVEEDIRRTKIIFPDFFITDEIMPGVYLEDTRNLSTIQFKKNPTIIVTSPPYANRYDYTRTYSLELCFHFVKTFEELKAVRFGILRSHIESKIQKDEIPPHPVIKEVVEALGTKNLNNPKIPAMLTTYFIDMQKVIQEWFTVLAPGASIAMVVDNVRFEGEMVPVDLILSEIAEEAGFDIKEIIVARYKGNSSQQMKKYGKVPVRESIVVWER
ncbi:MAG: hypothetical protein AYK19_14335 [Theionarchaea archaeon DG-70-1]|nr:MAG: hypothetical protein AYK19_14335 [Theionarchaea archaeon DG-70-1]